MVMEFLPSGTLESMLSPEPMEDVAVRTLIRQCLHAIRYLNDYDMIHHDVKPQNILIQCVAPLRVKLCDFGGAQNAISALITNELYGTPRYMAPDFGTEQHSFGVDVWAMGVVALNALGYWPWNPTIVDDSSVLPEFGHLSCTSLLEGMLDDNPSRRYRPVDCLQHPWLKLLHEKKRRRSDTEEETAICSPPSKRRKTYHIEENANSQAEIADVVRQPLNIVRSRLSAWWLGRPFFALLRRAFPTD